DFAMLFGDPKIYISSGYISVNNVLNDHTDESGKIKRSRVTPMVRQIGETLWPQQDVFLPGMKF
ncbi:MAG: GNAT family N-acetyltransferase, partial [Lentisphaerae bacterium]|nr:GNAT family N-acetyltransferase [Lentisphaerota bacterium]